MKINQKIRQRYMLLRYHSNFLKGCGEDALAQFVTLRKFVAIYFTL